MKSYELRMCPEVVRQLEMLSLRLAYERGHKESWASLVREGAEMILKAHAPPAAAAPATAGGGAR